MLQPENGRSCPMAKTPEVKKNRINRIRKANQKLQDCVDDAFVKAAGFIENAIYSAGRRAKKPQEKQPKRYQ